MKVLTDYTILRDLRPALFDRMIVVAVFGGSATTPADQELIDEVGKTLVLIQPMTEEHLRIAVEAQNSLLVTNGLDSLTYATSRLQKFEYDLKNRWVMVETQNRRFVILPEPKQSFLSRLKTLFNWGAP
jgi:hypothetical protein